MDRMSESTMVELLEGSESVKEWMNDVDLPKDIANAAFVALTSAAARNQDKDRSMVAPGCVPEPFEVVGKLIQKYYFPDAPGDEGLDTYIQGDGPPPDWLMGLMIGVQVAEEVNRRGGSVPINYGEDGMFGPTMKKIIDAQGD